MAPHRVLLFGDQTVEKLPSIRELVRISRSSPVLHRFLESAADVVQTEVAKLGVESRKAFESFDDLTTLAEGNENENADEIVATALMCIVRLGELLLCVIHPIIPNMMANPILLDTLKVMTVFLVALSLHYGCLVSARVFFLQQ